MPSKQFENLKTLNERAAYVICAIGDTIPIIAQNLGVNKNTITTYKKGKGDLKGVAIENLVKKYNVNPEWILTGMGSIYKDENIQKDKQSDRSESSSKNTDILDIEDSDIIKNFEDKKEGLDTNKNLITLEKLDPEEFYATTGRIRGKVKRILKANEKKETDFANRSTA